MIRIAIVEDEALYAEQLKSYLKRYEEEQGADLLDPHLFGRR